MRVKELIDLLQTEDPDATVLIMSQQNWPFEYAILGLTNREDIDDDDDDERPRSKADGQLSDVFLVEGEQLRYGSKEAWETCRRRRGRP